MIFLAFVHLFRNYFVGAYKKPRELQWVLGGVIMGAAVLGTAFFGYSLVGDTLSVDGADVAKGLLQGAPLGSLLLNIFFGPGGETAQFTRVLAWHITLAALVALLFALHLGLAEQNGVMPSPKLFNYKSPAELDRKEAPKWWPNNFLYTAAILFWVWGVHIDNTVHTLDAPARLHTHFAISITRTISYQCSRGQHTALPIVVLLECL